MKKEQEKEKQGSIFSGYVKLFCLLLVTVFVVLVLRKWYLDQQNYELKTSVISETLVQEINTKEIYNYVRENPDAVIYVGLVSDSDCRTFELDFNAIIRKRDLQDTITYLNLEKARDARSFFKEFNKFYDADLERYPAIVVFQNGVVSDILEVPLGEEYQSSIIEAFLDRNMVTNQ